jgi:acetyl-CoA carboxylase biotin carboxyl carrier protein
MNLKDIESLIQFVQKSGVSEVSLEQKDFKLIIKTSHGPAVSLPVQHMAPAPVPHIVAAPAAAAPASAPAAPKAPEAPKADDESKLVTIKSPMIGTFYRSSSPDKPPFVNVGDEIKAGKVICIIEAMKLFNEIEAEVSGRIVKVLVDNASPVEYDQPLFLVEPA